MGVEQWLCRAFLSAASSRRFDRNNRANASSTIQITASIAIELAYALSVHTAVRAESTAALV